jgi:hypothetical protein
VQPVIQQVTWKPPQRSPPRSMSLVAAPLPRRGRSARCLTHRSSGAARVWRLLLRGMSTESDQKEPSPFLRPKTTATSGLRR